MRMVIEESFFHVYSTFSSATNDGIVYPHQKEGQNKY